MFGKKKHGYTVTKYSCTADKDKLIFHLTMRDDNMVFITSGYDVIGGRVHMSMDEANDFYSKSCVDLGITEARD